MTPAEVLAYARENNVKVVDLRFLDLIGTWQHFSLPIGMLDDECFSDGFGFDGSSVRGWKTIDQSDMLVVPDPATAWIDPFLELRRLHRHRGCRRHSLHGVSGTTPPAVRRCRRPAI